MKLLHPRFLLCRNVLSAGMALLLLASTLHAARPAARTLTVNLRGKPQSVQIYEPAPGAPKRTVQVLVTSGDLGWLGISGDVPGHLQEQGYRVIGFNARTYVSSFTGGGGAHLEENWIPADYEAVVDAASKGSMFPKEFVSIGVSEGAGLAVLAMGQPGASALCRGIIALGLPLKTALGWRWTDFTAWISKREPNERLAETKEYLVRLKVPIVMVHSTRDEYDLIDNVRAIFADAPEPKRFIAVDASNHRFSNKIPEVMSILDTSISWMESLDRPTSR
ncbi:MAG: hypothetical protein LAP85_16955 [Acidobacteriia bacterium]|nr:hypothetical protein [Terriglobia bacterium]